VSEHFQIKTHVPGDVSFNVSYKCERSNCKISYV